MITGRNKKNVTEQNDHPIPHLIRMKATYFHTIHIVMYAVYLMASHGTNLPCRMSEDSERLVATAPHGVVGAGSSPQVHQQDIETSYNANRSFRLGSIQVVIGILCFIVGCVCIGGTSSSNLHGIGILSGGFVV